MTMNIDDYKYIWEIEKQDWVLVKTEFGYGIVNKKNQTALLVSEDELEEIIIAKMIEAGNKIYDSIIDAYNDVNHDV